MRIFQQASLQQKQVGIIMGICALTLLLASAGFVIHDTLAHKRELAANLLVRGGVLGRTCWGALDFSDPKAVEENLKALAADPHAVAATVFTENGERFAYYHRAGITNHHAALLSTNVATVFAANSLRVVQPIMRGSERLGYIEVESDLAALVAAMKYQAGIAAGLLVLATGLAYVLSARLQRIVSGPILDLLRTTRAVATDRDYSLRAHKASADELGQLVDGFNDMLEQVQARDRELRAARELLEARVAERTQELQQEVVERQQSEVRLRTALHEVESQQFALNESAIVDISDPRGIITYVNDRFCAISKYSRAELLGQNHRMLNSGQHPKELFQTLWATVKRGEVWRARVCNRAKDGSLYWVDSTIVPFKDEAGKITQYVTIRTDVTEQVQAEAARARLVNFLEASVNEVYVFDPEQLRFSYVNRSARQNLGYTLDELKERTPLDLKPEFTEATFRQALQPLLDGTVEKQVFQTIHRRADGTDYPVETCLQLVFTATEQVVLAVATDITERKQREAELARAQKDLVDISRQAGMAEVATGVLHNVGNVLNSVNVASTCLADGIRKSKAASLEKVVALLKAHETDLGGYFTHDPKAKLLPDYLAKLSEHIAREQAAALQELAALQQHIDHIKEIVTMQQSFAKVSGLTEVLDVTELVEEALRINQHSISNHRLEIVRDFAPVPKITVEKHQVLQILVNLLQNAKQACKISDRDDRRLTLRVLNAGDQVRISVSDTGIGIPPENLNRIFHHGFTTKKTGHGFGLHSSANAAKAMGGNLVAHSEGVGRGATFTLELPLRETKETV